MSLGPAGDASVIVRNTYDRAPEVVTLIPSRGLSDVSCTVCTWLTNVAHLYPYTSNY